MARCQRRDVRSHRRVGVVDARGSSDTSVEEPDLPDRLMCCGTGSGAMESRAVLLRSTPEDLQPPYGRPQSTPEIEPVRALERPGVGKAIGETEALG